MQGEPEHKEFGWNFKLGGRRVPGGVGERLSFNGAIEGLKDEIYLAMMEPKAVIFDLDDTIINTTQVILKWHSGVYEKFNAYLGGVSRREFEDAIEVVAAEAFKGELPVYQASVQLWFKALEILAIEPVPNLVFGLYSDLQIYTAKYCRLEPGFARLYAELKREGVRVGILSNGGFWEKGVKIKEIGLGEEKIVVVSTDMVGVDKPDPRAFQYILKKLEVKPKEAVMVGDNYEADYLGAKGAGLGAIWYASKTRGLKLSSHRIKNKVDHHDQVREMIEKMK